MKYANLVVDNKSDSTDRLFTYGCSEEDISIGDKVYVPFARSKKLKGAIVVSIEDDIGDESIREKLKFVEKKDKDVSLTAEMVRTARWMKTRYVCRYIDCLRCFLPVGSKAKRREPKDLLKGEKPEPYIQKELTSQQNVVLKEIEKSVNNEKHARFLLHGVTGSGKTEVYIQAADKVLRRGKTVIVLVPEISLTGQIIARFTGRFGHESIAILHSRLTQGERYDQWQKIKNGDVKIVIGARSAVFAPLADIGLIIIDEEHEATYKADQTPKYDTIEVALKRTGDKDNNGILLLGSATPSVVTYNRCEEGIYKLLELTQRYNDVKLPDVTVVDMRDEMKNGNRSIISEALYTETKRQLENGSQVMLLLNRRGYYTFIACRECGYVAKCPKCGLSLTYHKTTDKATCHYCGYEEDMRKVCPECGSKYIRYFGSGTEQLEETIGELFGGYTAERLDFDSVKKKGEMKRKLRNFSLGKTHILIGTQLIAKGLDFKNVGLVGIISADVSLNIPDFRSAERTFQLITQAAGRAGRGDKPGQVVIQTYAPDNYAIRHASAQDYKGFYSEEKKLRRYLVNPPYSDIFQIIFMSKEDEIAKTAADRWYDMIVERMEEEGIHNVFRPQEAYMNKINDTYRYSMMIRAPKGSRRRYSQILVDVKAEEQKIRNKKYTAIVDINPYSFA